MAELMPDIIEAMKIEYCFKDMLHCARFIVAENVGKEHVPEGLAPILETEAHKIVKKITGEYPRPNLQELHK